MGDLLIPLRLRWFDHAGFAKCDEVRVALKHPPRISGLPQNLHEIDYAPVEGVQVLREAPHVERRDMTPSEADAVKRHLYAMATAARDVLDGAESHATVVLPR